jgi:hypothetical protein
MTEAWHDGLSDEQLKTESDKAYEQAAAVLNDGLSRGLGFDEACAGIDVKDQQLRDVIIEDMLKVLIADNHFTKGIPLADIALHLKVDAKRLETAKESMLRELGEAAAIEYHSAHSEGDDGQTTH